jgi:catechol 2,3-dioxygenase-like lactoylglutathione lyase family enzyme
MNVSGIAFRFHHVGLAVHSLDAAQAALAATGLSRARDLPDAVDPTLKVRLRFLRNGPGQPLVELVEGLDPPNPVSNLLEKSGPGPYHLCFSVENLEAAGAHLRQHGYRAVTTRIPAVAFGGALVQFFFHLQCGMIELVELPSR